MPRFLLQFLLFSLSLLAMPILHAQDQAFARPAALEPAVNFWKRVYTEVGTNGGFIHDDTRLDVFVRMREAVGRAGWNPGLVDRPVILHVDRDRRRILVELFPHETKTMQQLLPPIMQKLVCRPSRL